MASWNTIPVELRLAILDIVFLDCTNEDVLLNSKRLGSSMNMKPGRIRHKSSRIKSLLSTVCREWQKYFEKQNFRDLVLTQTDLWPFLTMMKQTPTYRLAYVKRIHFKILLEEYDCTSCMTKEEEFTIQRNCAIFTYAIWHLISTLFQSTRPVLARDQAKTQLQISVFSPSDNHHCFWNWCLGDEYPLQHSDSWRTRGRNNRTEDDILDLPIRQLFKNMHKLGTSHNWHHVWNHRSSRLPDNRIVPVDFDNDWNPDTFDRLLGARPLTFDFSMLPGLGTRSTVRLPPVNVVKGLVIRRSNFRGISPDIIFRLIHEGFPQLQGIRVEKWRETSLKEQLRYQKEFANCLERKRLPTTLTHFAIVEDYHQKLHGLTPSPPRYQNLGSSLARASRNLVTLSAMWQVEAESFLADYLSPLTPGSPAMTPWERLREVHLTSTNIAGNPNSPEGKQDIRQILEASCRAARMMPHLQIMQIGSSGSTDPDIVKIAMFGYKRGEGSGIHPILDWVTSWPEKQTLDADDEAFKCWKELAKERNYGTEVLMRRFTGSVVVNTVLESGWSPASHWGISAFFEDPWVGFLDRTSLLEIQMGEKDWNASLPWRRLVVGSDRYWEH